MGCFDDSDNGVSFVDATTACNDCNDDVKGYFRSAVSKMLSIYDSCNAGRVRKCISLARHIPTPNISSNDIIPDSGATSTMRRNIYDFEDDYVKCDGVFVLMGDASKIPVAGYGTSRMKIDGNVTRLVNSLHVPELDYD